MVSKLLVRLSAGGTQTIQNAPFPAPVCGAEPAVSRDLDASDEAEKNAATGKVSEQYVFGAKPGKDGGYGHRIPDFDE